MRHYRPKSPNYRGFCVTHGFLHRHGASRMRHEKMACFLVLVTLVTVVTQNPGVYLP
jgi:hypothetical protein